MSSSGRGPRLDPTGLGDYPTPPWCVHRLLEWWTPRPGVWVEPCAGNGSIVRTLSDCLSSGYSPVWRTYELNQLRVDEYNARNKGRVGIYANYCADFLQLRSNVVDRQNCTAVITNPPFVKAVEFVAKSRELYPEAEVVMLLRVGFMESDERSEFWREVGVPDLGIFPNRPSFQNSETGALKTDSTVYSWFIWPPAIEGPRAEGRVKLLNHTSLEDRKRYR